MEEDAKATAATAGGKKKSDTELFSEMISKMNTSSHNQITDHNESETKTVSLYINNNCMVTSVLLIHCTTICEIKIYCII